MPRTSNSTESSTKPYNNINVHHFLKGSSRLSSNSFDYLECLRPLSHFKKQSCSNREAWQHALVRTSSLLVRDNMPVNNLSKVLPHYICIAISDSRIEQDSSNVDKFLGEHRLGGHSHTECDVVTLIC